jgi:crotonobetainyl-CoA:carnitine CoA-transferase CaiB-like acyl-CoA transferase
LQHQDELDDLVAAWTRVHEAEVVEALLQEHAIPAQVVLGMNDLARDPQLLHRGHFVTLESPQQGTSIVEGSRFTLSRTPAQITRPAPRLGRDNHYVLETLLGYSPERIATLEAQGVLQ